jgi:ABC-type glycerol-3-phosphate transport system permease component
LLGKTFLDFASGGVSDQIRADVYFLSSLMAARTLGSVPVAIAYSFFADHYISGLTSGASKRRTAGRNNYPS